MKLELKHLAPYLPYGLRFAHIEYFSDGTTDENIYFMNSLSEECIAFSGKGSDWHFDSEENECDIKPILRPLSDLEDDDENTPEYLQGCCYSYVENLISQHYDVFGLIELGLAIDINTLNAEYNETRKNY